jgi:hypothetical protein
MGQEFGLLALGTDRDSRFLADNRLLDDTAVNSDLGVVVVATASEMRAVPIVEWEDHGVRHASDKHGDCMAPSHRIVVVQDSAAHEVELDIW